MWCHATRHGEDIRKRGTGSKHFKRGSLFFFHFVLSHSHGSLVNGIEIVLVMDVVPLNSLAA